MWWWTNDYICIVTTSTPLLWILKGGGNIGVTFPRCEFSSVYRIWFLFWGFTQHGQNYIFKFYFGARWFNSTTCLYHGIVNGVYISITVYIWEASFRYAKKLLSVIKGAVTIVIRVVLQLCYAKVYKLFGCHEADILTNGLNFGLFDFTNYVRFPQFYQTKHF